MKYIAISAMAFFLLSCSKNEATIPKTDNESLNEMLATAQSASVIQIESTIVDTIFAEQSNIITPKIDSSQMFLGRVSGLTSINDSLYIADLQNATIWMIHEDRGTIQTIGRKGGGPGEFESLMGVEHNSTSIFSVESSRIQQFNNNMTFKNEISQIVHGNKVGVSDSYLFVPLSPYSNEELIQVREASHPFDEVIRIIQPIIPPGFQPGAYNGVEIAVNKSGQLIAAYFGLPYLFVFNSEFNIEHVLYFKFAEGESPDNPSIEPIQNSEPIGVSAFISNLNYLDNRTIYFTYSMKLFRIVQDGDNYKLDKIVHFTFADSEKREQTPWGLQPTSLHVQNGKIYIASIFEESIYRFQLEDSD